MIAHRWLGSLLYGRGQDASVPAWFHQRILDEIQKVAPVSRWNGFLTVLSLIPNMLLHRLLWPLHQRRIRASLPAAVQGPPPSVSSWGILVGLACVVALVPVGLLYPIVWTVLVLGREVAEARAVLTRGPHLYTTTAAVLRGRLTGHEQLRLAETPGNDG